MKGTETQRELQKRREFWLMVRQVPPMALKLEAGAAVALIVQVQIAHRCQPQSGLLAATAQGVAKRLIAQFPAPVAAMMNREWQRPPGVGSQTPAAVPVKPAASEASAEPVAPCDPPPSVRLCFRLCGKLLLAAGAILAWRAMAWMRRPVGRA